MAKIGEIAKGMLIVFCGYYLLIAAEQAASGQTALAAFMFAGFLIPLAIVTYGNFKDRKKRQTSANERHA